MGRSNAAWFSLGLGIAVMAAGFAVWTQFIKHDFTDRLIRKLPPDAYVAGVSRFSTTHPDTIKQITASAKLNPQTTPVLDVVLGAADLHALRRVLGDEYAFAESTQGGMMVGTIRRPTRYGELESRFAATLDKVKHGEVDGLPYTVGRVHGTKTQVAVARDGGYVYAASNPDLLPALRDQPDGFTSVERFHEVAKTLPSRVDGYLFFNITPVQKSVGIASPLIGTSFRTNGRYLDLHVSRATTSQVTTHLQGTDGRLLPPARVTTSIEGSDLVGYLHLLEEQRQEEDVPKVLQLRNGLRKLSGQIGQDIERTYIQAANGHFAYGRYKSKEGEQWVLTLEFPDARTARSKVNALKDKLATRVKVPVRHEVVTILPDNTQSREIVAQGPEPLQFSEEKIGDKTGFSFKVPGSLGTVHFVQSGPYLVAGSSLQAETIVLGSLSGKTSAGSHGDLAIRVKLSRAQDFLLKPDTLADWVLATTPTSATLRLDTANGILEGTVNFAYSS